ENLEELVAASEEFVADQETLGASDVRIEAFLDSIALVADVDEKDDEAGGVFPHSRSMNDADELEEERRLCYVGITRAKQRLFLSYALHRRIQGYGVGEPSRFLLEIPESELTMLNAARSERAAA